MSRKGKLAEILSKAMYADNPNSYTVGYLDYDTIKEVTLPEFIKISDSFETIPITRIHYIKKDDKTLYSKIVKKDSEVF
jgi:outer membrane biogenesis lipoprotein LolB